MDRDAIEALGDDETLRAEAARLGVTGDPTAMSRLELVDAIHLRLSAIDDPSSVGWAMRTWRKAPPAEAESHGGIFIDRGLPVPERYSGGHWLRASIRDPRTLYTYWETDHDAADGWRVSAHGDSGELAHVDTAPCPVGAGFLLIDDIAAVRRVVLGRRRGDAVETVLEVEVSVAPPEAVADVTWLDVRTRTPVDAPAAGRWEGRSEMPSGLRDVPGYSAAGLGHGELPSSGTRPTSPAGS